MGRTDFGDYLAIYRSNGDKDIEGIGYPGEVLG